MELSELKPQELNLVQLLRSDKKLADYVKTFLTQYKWKHTTEMPIDALIRSFYGLDEDETLDIRR